MTAHGLPDEMRRVRASMRDFIDGEVIPAEPVIDDGGEAAAKTLEDLKHEAKRRGLWALGHPAEIGGGGLPFMDFVYLNEIIGRSEYGQVAVGTLSMQDSIMLHRHGTAEQQQRWLVPLVAGEILPSVGLTEPEVAGSDPTLMQTSAVLDGDAWVINGHKWFTSGANRAAFTTVFAKTEPSEPSRYRPVLRHSGADRHAGIRHRPRRPDHGTHGREPLRGVLPRRPGAPLRNLLGERGAGLRHRPAPARPRPHLPLHALVGAGAACLRADVRPGHDPVRPRLAALRERRDPAVHRRIGRRDPRGTVDDPRRRPCPRSGRCRHASRSA